ncbi:unnamed protein product [Chrysodeixis includens]|uniref:LITAF domain-containing protein n=1 Tax=Chrysodeixis includens TaxID=689277 RepID=A0A9N8PZZ7_CHRIL|nr:unnamed protein product [Chrysodeixis includens]
MSSYPDAPPPYSAEPIPQGVTVVQLQPQPVSNIPIAIPINAPMGPQPAILVCSACQQQIMTRVEMRNTTKTHCWALCCCVFLCWPCACLPYCMPACKDVTHYCPNCDAYIGAYKN